MTVVPELRFKRDDRSVYPDWNEIRLGEVASFTKGKGISKADIEENGRTPCIRYGEIYTVYREIISDVVSATNVDPKNLRLSRGGEVIIPASGEDPLDMARACVVSHAGVAIGGDINIMTGISNGIFAAYYLNNAKRREIARLVQGNSVCHLYGSHLAGVHIKVPHPDEQQKIAAFLGAVDDKIDALRRKCDGLKQFKSGLMQKLFSQELRFKRDDGSDFPDWKEKRLGEVEAEGMIKLGRGNVISKNDLAEFPGDNPVYSSSATDKGEFGRYGKWMFDEELITWSIDGGGKFFHRPRHRFSVTNVCGYLRINSDLLRYRFLAAALERQHARQTYDYQSKAHPSVIRGRYFIPLADQDEQQKIADCLSAVDAKIEAVEGQITQMEAFKKGLLQKMFV